EWLIKIKIFDANESHEKQKIVRGKKRTSTVWNNYDLITKTDGAWAVCKYCKHKMKAAGHVGTTNARRHSEKSDAYVEFVTNNPASNAVYDHDTYVRMFAESIFYHGYSLSMVEHIKTRDLHRYLNPEVKDISRYTIYDSHKDPSNAVRKMAKTMWEKFDKYWSEHSLILSFGLLVDPRYKMACLNDLFSSLYVPVAVEGMAQSVSYPTLALMTRDILAIPITSIAYESAFSAGGRILNKLRSSLSPKNVEILVTMGSWSFGFEPEENDEVVLSVAREATTDDVANE
ncbi:putative AC transposase, partial [Bienertia sinuspersici]